MQTDAQRSRRLYAYPLQIVRTRDGAVARRGNVRLRVRGERALDILLEITQAASRPNGSTDAEIAAGFDDEVRPAVNDLVDVLVSRRLLVTLEHGGGEFFARTSNEEREDVFFWVFNTDRTEVERRISTRRVAVIGVNSVSRTLTPALRAAGFGAVATVDHPLLRSVQFFDAAGSLSRETWNCGEPIAYAEWADAGELPDCLVTTSDFGGLSLMREWNEFCVKSEIAFYPVVLHDMIGFAGPLVLPERTACFECFWLRQNSNLESDASRRETEETAFHGQIVDGFVPPMTATLGQIAAFELFRYYALRTSAGFRPSTMIEIDLLGGSMTSRRLLRVPRCPVCGTGRRHAKVAIERGTDVPQNLTEG